MTDLDLRPIARAEFPAFFRTVCDVFGDDVREDDRAALGTLVEWDRTLAAFDGDEIVGTAVAFSRELTVPGGPRPAAAVSLVTVQPTHRRRGLLTAMMRRQLDELREREPVAILWAAEAAIYGRFGYGPAARQASWRVARDRLALRADVPADDGRAVLVPTERARPHQVAVHEALRARTTGYLDRPGGWADRLLRDPPHLRGGASTRRHVLWTGADGAVTGYLTYRLAGNWARPDGGAEVRLEELAALTPGAYAGLWRYLAGIDLRPTLVRGRAPLDDPLPAMLADLRAVEETAYDSLWVRLVDVGRALAARTYRVPVDVVLGVRDGFCPWNAGSWRLVGGPGGASCERTDEPAAVTLDVQELGSAYLGGPTLTALAAAGLVDGPADVVAELSLAFSGERQPWCPEMF